MTYVPYAHIASTDTGVSDPASFSRIPREDLARLIDRMGPNHVHRACRCGGKLAGDVGAAPLKELEKFDLAHGRCR